MHYCQKVEIDDLFLDKTDETVLAFDNIYQQYLDMKDVDISATKNCVVFLRNKTFLVIKPMKKWLEVKFFSDELIDDDSLHKFGKQGKNYFGILRFENEHEINQRYLEYFRYSYEIC
ncbi:MAG: DUF5655 domain-containing protein [Crocinitomicaceae bacterium]